MKTLVRVAFGAAVMMSAVGPAQADTTASFNGLVLDTCILTLATAGVLGSMDDGTTLSSTAPSGVPVEATITATSAAYEFQVDAPTGFAQAPSGGQPDSTALSYTATGVSTGNLLPAGTPLDLGLGVTQVALNSEAHKASGVFPAGTYRMDVVMRCAPR